MCIDWDDSAADLSILAGGKPGSGAEPVNTDSLWEENWDDEDLEDDFSKQLRYAS